MLTANYLTDIVSGLIKDISVSLEVEGVLYEILSDSDLLIGEDDIEVIKSFDDSLIYRGTSYRGITCNEDVSKIDKVKLINKKINDFNSCFYWSKSMSGLKKLMAGKNIKFLVTSIVEGIDMLNLSKRLVKFSRSIKRKGYENKYEEFYRFRSDYKSKGLIVAPNGRNTEIIVI